MYDLYLFDLDGTIINTEQLHYQAYFDTLKFFDIEVNFDFNIYSKYAHYDDVLMKNFIESISSIPYEKFYSKKKEFYFKYLDSKLDIITGTPELINKLKKNNIPVCLVTHSDNETIELLKTKVPILHQFDKIVCKDDYFNKKPNPECYLKCLSFFPDKKNPIGFEDSYKGYMSLKSANITSVFIGDQSYYYFNKIKPVNVIKDFTEFNEEKIIPAKTNFNDWVDSKINIYKNQIINSTQNFVPVISSLIPLIKSCKNNIYLTGIGKCGHICKKSISTWQSMGISCQYLNLIDLFHGDFGILKSNDMIIYISNSGNTTEVINCAKYIKEHFKIFQIAVTLNDNNHIKEYTNFNFVIGNNIREIDNINMAPTTSSVIFMMFLDMLGVYLSDENQLSVEKFQLYHPGGVLGKKSTKILDYVVIVASGLGTRLYPLTLHIPKILVTFKNETFIETLIKYWKQYTDNIIIVYNSQFKSLIEFYTNNYSNIKLIPFDETTGTADTINKTITNEYYGKNILFSWCDIIPDQTIDLNKLNQTTIFTYGNQCRYLAKVNQIIKISNGNVIGIYYIKNYQGVNKYNIGDDICDNFKNNFGDFNIYSLDKLVDIGDMDKFKNYILDNQTRFFNKISYYNNYIIKESVNDQGNEIIKKEINWYVEIDNKYSFLPKFEILGETNFKLELLNGIPIYKKFKYFDIKQRQNIVDSIYKNLEILHQTTCDISVEANIKNINFECYDKIIERINKIKPIIDYYKINSVNGIKIESLTFVLNKMKKILTSDLSNQYSLIHGDCTFSNTMIDSNDKIYFIDPRGYFGKSLLYGPKEYDYAKLLYSLSGYDLFNVDNLFSIEIENQNIKFNIETFLDGLHIIINDKVKAWLVIIWFGLAQYNSNNVLKCLASYYNGFYWYNKLFS
jgi:HAD superfamily hydrolase (TIGR01509 family)